MRATSKPADAICDMLKTNTPGGRFAGKSALNVADIQLTATTRTSGMSMRALEDSPTALGNVPLDVETRLSGAAWCEVMRRP
jgi:hypothetical protein